LPKHTASQNEALLAQICTFQPRAGGIKTFSEHTAPAFFTEKTRSTVAISTGLLEAALCAALLLLVTNVLPFFFKTGYVKPTGSIKVAPFFGFLLAVGLLLRKEWARKGAVLLGLFLVAANVAPLLGTAGAKPGYGVSLLLSGLLLWRVLFSPNLRQQE
jgi:hypothetical protein